MSNAVVIWGQNAQVDTSRGGHVRRRIEHDFTCHVIGKNILNLRSFKSQKYLIRGQKRSFHEGVEV